MKMQLLGKTKPKYDESGNLLTNTKGLSTVEYLILLVVIAVAGISIWKEVGGTVAQKATDSNQVLGGLSTSPTSPSP